MRLSQSQIERINRLWLTMSLDSKEWDESKHPRAANGQFGKASNNQQETAEIGPFGKIYTNFRHDDKGAIKKLTTEINVKIQPQSLSTNDLQFFDSLAQQGQLLNVYISGQIHALRRLSQQGADKLVFKAFGEKTESEWLIKSVAESFPNWCKVVVWRQK